MLLQNFLEESAKKFRKKVALIHKGERWTYEEINERSNQLATFLRDRGVCRGDRVAIFMDNSVESVISLFGILKADAIFIMLSPSLKSSKLNYILNNCQAKALITHVNKLNVLMDLFEATPTIQFTIFSGDKTKIPVNYLSTSIFWNEIFSSSYPTRLISYANIDLDLATIIYTSGSTGDPKGVMLTHLNMISAATSITTYLDNVPEDIIIDVLPLSFDYGLYQVLMAFKFGGTVVLEQSFTYPYEIIKRMVQERVTGFPGVPTLFAILLQMEDLKKFDLSSLRYITNTGASLPVEHIQRLRTIFPWVKIYSMYGLTECKRVSYLPPEELDRRPGSVGRGMPNEEVWIVDESGNRVGPGVVGELVVRGSNVMRGYWGDPEATDRVLRPGPIYGEKVLYTGDLFKADEEGFLYFVGRKDDMIKTKGERVSPKEVENVLYKIEGVVEAAVIPVPDDILGQAIKAFVVIKNGYPITEREILKHCKNELEDFAVPKYIEFRNSLPKTSSGKIDKLTLKQETMGI